MTLYADVLFAINFSMDFLALFICSIILHRKSSKLRMVLASVLGAIFGVIEIIFSWGLILTAILSVIVSIVMCIVAFFEKNIKRFTFTVIMFWIVSMALGGVMSFLYSILNKALASVIENFSPIVTYNGARFFIIISITAIVGIMFSRIFSAKKEIKSIDVTVIIDKTEYKISALCDTGNMLTEPISAKPVILVCEGTEVGKRILEIDDHYKRYIPYSDASSTGMLKGYIPKKVLVGKNSVDAVIATIKKDKFAEFDGLVPMSLV